MRFFLSVLACVVGTQASAAMVTYDFSARFFNDVGSDAGVSSMVDTARGFASLTGTLTFDDTPTSSGSTFANFASPTIAIDQFDASGILPAVELRLRDRAAGQVDSIETNPAAIPQDGAVYDRISLFFRGIDALSGTAFPDPLSLASFNTAAIMAFIANDNSQVGALERVDFQFTQLTKRTPVVPLPAGLPLLIGGLGALALLRRKA